MNNIFEKSILASTFTRQINQRFDLIDANNAILVYFTYMMSNCYYMEEHKLLYKLMLFLVQV